MGICQESQCGHLGTGYNANLVNITEGYSIGSRQLLRCQEGYILKFPMAGNVPVKEVTVKCQGLASIATSPIPLWTFLDDSPLHSCQVGCLDNWDCQVNQYCSSRNLCELRSCSLPSLIHANIILNDQVPTVGTIGTVKCQNGYHPGKNNKFLVELQVVCVTELESNRGILIDVFGDLVVDCLPGNLKKLIIVVYISKPW